MCVYIGGGEAISLLEKWLFEHMNKLLEREAFIGSVRVKCPELENNFLFKVIAAFCVSLVLGKTANCHVAGRVVREGREIGRHFNLPNHSTHNITFGGLSLHQRNKENCKNVEQKFM